MKAEEINIGKLIESLLQKQSLNRSEVARNAGISPQRLNGWLKKDDLYVKELFKLSKALGFDFLEAFRIKNVEEEQETEITLQIKIPNDKKLCSCRK